MLFDLHAATELQTAFTTPPSEVLARRKTAMCALDTINRCHGLGTLVVAAAGLRPAWSMRRGQCSPRYTTNWEELPVAAALWVRGGR